MLNSSHRQFQTNYFIFLLISATFLFNGIAAMKKASGNQPQHFASEFIPVPDCRALENMGILFEKSSQFNDCTLVSSDGKEFKVYKGILACRSPVFAAMFEHPMAENEQGAVKIDDIKAPVLEQLLRFIYNGTAPNLDEMAEELLIAADKYELERLKALCERSLIQSMNHINACDMLVFATRHSAEHLRDRAIRYIKKKANLVLESDSWKAMIKRNTDGDMFNEIMKTFVRTD